MHQTFAVDDVDLGTAFQKLTHNLATREVLARAAAEDSDNMTPTGNVISEDGKEPHASIIIGKTRHNVKGAVAKGLLAHPDAFKDRNQSLAVSGRVDVRM
jgi:hypothetical protein